MQIDWEALCRTVTLFAVIFLLLLLNALRQVRLANPIELLHSEQVGENRRGRIGSWRSQGR